MATEGMSQYAVIIRVKELKRQLRACYNPETLIKLYNLIDLLEEVPSAKTKETRPGGDGAADQTATSGPGTRP